MALIVNDGTVLDNLVYCIYSMRKKIGENEN